MEEFGCGSDFCLSLVDGHCDTQKSISSFVSSKCTVFNHLPILGMATRMPLSLNLNQCLKSMWVVIFGVLPIHLLRLSTVAILYQSIAIIGFQEKPLFFHSHSYGLSGW